MLLVNINPKTGKSDGLLNRLKTAEEHLQSWIGWVYKPFVPITGPGESIINSETGEIREEYTRLFSRTFAHAVAGRVISMKFDDESKRFVLEFVPDFSVAKPTEIRVMKRIHYPEGYDVQVEPTEACRVNMDKAGENENLIQIFNVQEATVKDQIVKITVEPIK